MNRERIVEEALQHELPAMNAPAGPACLDAETLAAWEDNGLDAPAMASVEAHLSSCARCQTLVALTAKSAPATPATEPRSAFAWWRWAAPLAAGAAAVTLWMVVPQQREVAMAPPQPSAVAPADAMPPSAKQKSAPSPLTAQPSSPPPAIAREDRAPLHDTAVQEKQERAKTAAETAAPVEIAGAASTPPPEATPAAPAVTMQRSARFAAPVVEVVSPVAAQRWRVSPGGIEHTQDNGMTWTLIRPPQGESITGGTAPSPTICWLVGQAGVVLLTTDSITFTRVDVPDRSDVAAITAADGESATVTMSSGRTFHTSDGGRSWQ